MLAQVSLSQYEERLRRLLGLVGEVPVAVGETLVPMLTVGDATAPGCPQFRGRRFARGDRFTAGAGWSCQFKAQAELVITRFAVQASGAALTVKLNVVDPSVADPFAIATQFCVFTERTKASSDFAPILRSALPAAASADGTPVGQFDTNAVPSPLVELIRQPLMLEIGGKLNLNCANVATPVNFILEGYVF